MSTAIDAALVARFKAALERLNPDGGKIGLAVSGGPDSMAMFLLAHEAIPGEFEVATVDHGLRPEARDECALVERACAGRGVPCEVRSIQLEGGNLQARAREARYRTLRRWAEKRTLSAIATAHHADDQAETLLMRLNRGSGLAGLAGVRSRRDLGKTRIIRPLLDWRKAELEKVCSDCGTETAADPSNVDDRFERVRVRQILAQSDLIDPLAVARSAELLGEAHEFVTYLAGNIASTSKMPDGRGYRYFTDINPESESHFLEIEVVLRIIEKLGGSASRSDVASMINRLRQEENASLGGVLASIDDERAWFFRPEPPRRTG